LSVELFLLWGKPLIPVAGAIAMFLPLLVVPVVSLMSQPPKPEIIAIAFGDKSDSKLDKSSSSRRLAVWCNFTWSQF
jgi:hypothetical protein